MSHHDSSQHSRHEVNLLIRSEEHTSELQSRQYLVCRLLLEKKDPAAAGGSSSPLPGPVRLATRVRGIREDRLPVSEFDHAGARVAVVFVHLYVEALRSALL